MGRILRHVPLRNENESTLGKKEHGLLTKNVQEYGRWPTVCLWGYGETKTMDIQIGKLP